MPRGLPEIVAVGGGWDYSLALRRDGTIAAWGWREFVPTNVPLWFTNVVSIAAGDSHALAVQRNGTVGAWSHWPMMTNFLASWTNVVAVAAGFSHSLALTDEGTVLAAGAICERDSDDPPCPAYVPAGLTGVVAIAAGGYDSLALRRDGTVLSWVSSALKSWDPGSWQWLLARGAALVWWAMVRRGSPCSRGIVTFSRGAMSDSPPWS